MSASRRRRRMEIRIQDGKVKAESLDFTSGSAGAVVIGGEYVPGKGFTGGTQIQVESWSMTTRKPIDQQAN